MADCHHPQNELRPTGVSGVSVCASCRERIPCPHPFHRLVLGDHPIVCSACNMTLHFRPFRATDLAHRLPA
jgi:hypothetical protein